MIGNFIILFLCLMVFFQLPSDLVSVLSGLEIWMVSKCNQGRKSTGPRHSDEFMSKTGCMGGGAEGKRERVRWSVSIWDRKGTESEVKSLGRVRLFATLWTVANQALPSMVFSKQEYWSGSPFPSPGDLSDPGIQPSSPALLSEPLGKSERGRRRRQRQKD